MFAISQQKITIKFNQMLTLRQSVSETFNNCKSQINQSMNHNYLKETKEYMYFFSNMQLLIILSSKLYPLEKTKSKLKY